MRASGPPANRCPRCGNDLPPDVAGGVCPACAFGEALLEPPAESGAGRLSLDDIPASAWQEVAPQAAGAVKSAKARSLPSKNRDKPGDRIGCYKLLEEIGEGGCGVVYVAEQEQPVRRRVALKVIKLGMDTREVIARFEAERQALALMDHPNIAKVLDAGATETGRPYFVMELVKGLRITDYCDRNNLATTERLGLFIQVCHAIQHAHQKGIIHRDIKPSNILVTLHDGVPVPKVIDFGIAKATTNQRLTDKTVYTAIQQFIGTPAYMSPEQAELSGLDIDTRSDIYALGVLLYELLTGKTPFDSKRLVEAGLDEIRRIIREEEPPRPSTRISTLTDAEQTTIAKRRHSEPPKLQGIIRGDLDWMVMKTLEKDRTRRYETSSGLAADIQRYLSNEPVVARPPSQLYRFQKLVRRNKLAFASGTTVAASLVIALTLSLIFSFSERTERKRADEQASIAEAAIDFLQNDLLSQADPRKQADGGFAPDPNLTVREALDRASKRIEGRFKGQPLLEAAVRQAIGDALQGVGDAEQALPHLQRAVELCRANLMPDHPSLLRAKNNLATAYRAAGKLDLALPLFEETLNLRKAKLVLDHPDTLTAMNNLARAYLENGQFDQALLRFEEALKRCKAVLGPDHRTTLTAMNNLARAYEAAGNFGQAQMLSEETLKLRKATLVPDHPDTLTAMNNLAWTYLIAGKLDQAQPLLEETLQLRKAKQGPDAPDTLISMHNLARAYLDAGKLDKALPLFEETLKLRKPKLGPAHPQTLLTMAYLGKCQLRQKSYTNAELLLRQCFDLRQKVIPNDWSTFETQSLLGEAVLGQQKYVDAEPFLVGGYAGLKARDPRIPAYARSSLREAVERLVALYQAWRKPDEAAKWKRELEPIQRREAVKPSAAASEEVVK